MCVPLPGGGRGPGDNDGDDDGTDDDDYDDGADDYDDWCRQCCVCAHARQHPSLSETLPLCQYTAPEIHIANYMCKPELT